MHPEWGHIKSIQESGWNQSGHLCEQKKKILYLTQIWTKRDGKGTRNKVNSDTKNNRTAVHSACSCWAAMPHLQGRTRGSWVQAWVCGWVRGEVEPFMAQNTCITCINTWSWCLVSQRSLVNFIVNSLEFQRPEITWKVTFQSALQHRETHRDIEWVSDTQETLIRVSDASLGLGKAEVPAVFHSFLLKGST